jgi:hypothetical protein
MLGTSKWVVLCAVVASACSTGDIRVDPADLEVRDLLGVAPEVAASWDAAQRESARHVLGDALHAGSDAAGPLAVHAGSIEDRIAELDARRENAGDDSLGLVVLDGERATPIATDLADTARVLELAFDDGWRSQPIGPERGAGVLATFGGDAGHAQGTLTIVPAPRLAAIAAYEHGRLVVNPIVIAALEPTGATTQIVSDVAMAAHHVTAHPDRPANDGIATPANGSIGNPYSFYGSVEECAAAQRSRCEACMPSSDCVPVTNTSDGNAECTMLDANGGRGYFLLCINAALAITSVDNCAQSHAASCPRNTKAADSLSDLEANADFLDMPDCNSALDSCLATIYGKPGASYPGPGVDAGTTEPPRSTNVSCGDSCSNDKNCEASPNCSCTGPSCNNSLSCDSTCASSNNSSGCGGTSCDSCSSSSSGGSSGGGGGGGGTCSSNSSGGSSGGGGGCSSCNDSSSTSSSGGGCSGCSSNSSSSGGSSGCSGGSCGGSSSSSNSSCGGGGGKCSVARGEPNAAFALMLSMMWGLLPVPFAAAARRRARKRRARENDEEVKS